MCRCTVIILRILGIFVCILYCIRNQIWVDFPEQFRKRSSYHLRIYCGDMMKIQFPLSANAKIGMIRSVLLNSYSGKNTRRLNEYIGSPHIGSITRSQGFRKVYVWRSVDGSGRESISVTVNTIWLRIMT